MASRSLGTLTLDLIAKIGGFISGMTEAERVADRKARDIARKQKQRADEVKKAWDSTTKFIAGAFAGLSVAGAMASFIRETVAAEKEQQQLAAALKATGGAAGFTAGQLNKMAAELAGGSTFSEGDITRAQTRLLSYTGVVGDTFPRAMQAVIDTSARMGMTVEQAAETIGRALDIPSKGMEALSKQGFRFTDSQKDAVKEMERLGRTAEAQAMVLEAVETAYGGAAAAARDTLGGAVSALQNELRSLMTGKDGSLDGMRGAVETLVQLLRDPATKEAFGNFVSFLASVATLTVNVGAALLTLPSKLGRGLAEMINGSDTMSGQINGMQRELDGLNKELANYDRVQSMVDQGQAARNYLTKEEVAGLRARRDELAKNIDAARSLQSALSATAGGAGGGGGGTRGPTQAEIEALAKAEEARKNAERAAQAALKTAQSYLENLQRQLRATEDLSVAETVLRDIQEGRVKLVGGITQQQLLDIAKQIDLDRELVEIEKEFTKLKEEQKRKQEELADAGRRVYEATRTPTEQLSRELERLDDLLAKGAISWDTYGRAVFDAQEAFEKASKESSKAQTDMEKFMEKAREGVQSAIGDGLFDIMQGNFDNIGQGFKRMLDRMVAEALAADIMKRLFGDSKTGGGLFDTAFKFIGNMFGGGRAAGGEVLPGQVYRVNENGPEMLEMGGSQYLMMGNRAGRVIPSGAGRGGLNVQVSPPAGMTTETALQYGRRIGQGIAMATERNG